MALGEGVASGVLTTKRKDWDAVITDIYSRMVGKAPFALGIVAREKTLLGASVRYRFNPNFSMPKAGEFIRKALTDKTLDGIFQSDQGLSSGGTPGLYKVTGDGLPLPKNSLIIRVLNTADDRFRAVVIFGGERMEGQLETRMKSLGDILSGAKLKPEDDPEFMINQLKKINVKRLFDYDMATLTKIANALEHDKNSLPLELKPKMKAVLDHIMKKQLKR